VGRGASKAERAIMGPSCLASAPWAGLTCLLCKGFVKSILHEVGRFFAGEEFYERLVGGLR